MKRMLIIEDDENLSRGISFAFEKDGFSVSLATTSKEGWSLFQQYPFDIVILDLGLPDENGMELCKKIHECSNVSIIILTACDLETDEVAGLMAGADDYITKPFSLSVLRARVQRVCERSNPTEESTIQSHGYKLDLNLCKLYKDTKEIPITKAEFRLISYLMNHAGQVLTKEQILAALWDSHGDFVDENTLAVNISRLRAKIEKNPKNPEFLKTVRGIGYVWSKE